MRGGWAMVSLMISMRLALASTARVCAWLLRASGTDGALQLPTHAELAWRLNTTRESITRVLQKLLTDQVLQRDGDWWRIQAPTTLQELARGER